MAGVRSNLLQSQYFQLQWDQTGTVHCPALFQNTQRSISYKIQTEVSEEPSEQDKSINITVWWWSLTLCFRSIELSVFQDFSDNSGYKSNMNKSELFPINSLARKISFQSFQFKWLIQTLKLYICIRISEKFHCISFLQSTKATAYIDLKICI